MIYYFLRKGVFPMSRVLPSLLTLLLVAPMLGQTGKPQPAQSVLDAAIKKAKASHKPIFLMFDASW